MTDFVWLANKPMDLCSSTPILGEQSQGYSSLRGTGTCFYSKFKCLCKEYEVFMAICQSPSYCSYLSSSTASIFHVNNEFCLESSSLTSCSTVTPCKLYNVLIVQYKLTGKPADRCLLKNGCRLGLFIIYAWIVTA